MTLSVGIVVYGNDVRKQKRLNWLQQQLGADRLVVINNHDTVHMPGDLAGDNRFYEFSGYLELVKLFEGEDGSFLIFNDTIFKTHWLWGWVWLLKRLLAAQVNKPATILGDLRFDGEELVERPHPFMASWIFWLSDADALKEFRASLESVCCLPLPEVSEAYQFFLDSWISPGNRLRGWHGRVLEGEVKRKKLCVMLEHALSRELIHRPVKTGGFGEVHSVFYRLLRIIDRLRTRWESFRR